MEDTVLLEYLSKYNDEYLADLKLRLEDKGFIVSALSPGISFYRKNAVKNKTYPESECYSFSGKQARVVWELLELESQNKL